MRMQHIMQANTSNTLAQPGTNRLPIGARIEALHEDGTWHAGRIRRRDADDDCVVSVDPLVGVVRHTTAECA